MPTDLKKLYPQAQAVKRGAVSVEVPGATKVDGETIPRRNVKAKDALKMHPREGVTTLYELLRWSAKTYGNAKACGSRKTVNTHVEKKKIKKMVDGEQVEVDKEWTYYELSPYKYMSFVEFEKLALTLGSGLKALGLVPQDRLHIFASTSAQWLAMAHGKPLSPCKMAI